MKYDKLVRDKTPEYIKSKGDSPETHIATDEEFWVRLREKLQEETNKFLKSESIEDMADILEVIDAVCEYKKFNNSVLQNTKEQKAAERGRYKDKIILDKIADKVSDKM